jgi:hypothetical protein
MPEIKSYDWEQLNPLFWSEISSSYMIHNIFQKHKELARDFITKFLEVDKERIDLNRLSVQREKNYPGEGHIDVFIAVEKEFSVLIEVKVHDYRSTRPEQLITYYKAALENLKNEGFKSIYLVFVTQFTRDNFGEPSGYNLPPTIDEFEATQGSLPEYSKNMRHISWDELHSFIKDHYLQLTEEEKLIIDLHTQWLKGKNIEDKKNALQEAKDRSLEEYLGQTAAHLPEKLPFGKKEENSLRIKLKDISRNDAAQLVRVIEQIIESPKISKKQIEKKESTIRAAKKFVTGLAKNQEEWKLLSIYSTIFELVNSRDYLQLDGTGASGFSIVIGIEKQGRLSLCTFWTKRHEVEFKLMR